MNDIIRTIKQIGIVPVVVLDDAKDALPLAEALLESGLPCAEITFRTDAAEEAIRQITKAFPNMLVGAGTVLTTRQADRAIDAGAQFIVSPGSNPKVIEHVLEQGVLMIPGVCTPTEIESVLGYGFKTLKFFPAEAMGGLKTIKAIAAPYAGINFMPTGGINAENVRDYLAYDRITACGGSWMVKNTLIKDGNFKEIKRLTKQAAAIVREIRG